jgi:hypothetical protein
MSSEYTAKSSPLMSVRAPTVTADGLVVVWSSTENTRSFEDHRQSVFTGLFCDGVRIGFGAPPFKEYVRASEAVRWMREEAIARKLNRVLSPSCSELGVTDSLFLSRNPRFDMTATAAVDPHSLLQTHNQQTMVRRMQRLDSIADSYRSGRPRLEPRRSDAYTSIAHYLRFDPVTNTEICLIPTTQRGIVESELLLWLRLWRLVVPTLLAVNVFGNRVWLFSAFGLMLVISSARILARRREWNTPLEHFLLVTQDGVFQQAGENCKAILWPCVSQLTKSFWNFGELHVANACPKEGILNINKEKLVFPLGFSSGADIFGSLEWGKQYTRDRWQWEVFASPKADTTRSSTGPLVKLLVAVASYDYLQKLPGFEDLNIAKSFFEDESAISVTDPSLPQLREQLDTAFSKATHGTALFYFTGHAVIRDRELQLMTREANSKSRSSGFPLHKLLDLQQERSVSDVIVILDCCFSGTGANSLDISLRDFRSWLDKIRRGVTGRFWLIAASREDQESLSAKSASLFSSALFSSAKELCDSDGMLRISEWYEATAKRMRFGQQPVFFAFDEPSRRIQLGAVPTRISIKAKELREGARSRREQQRNRLEAIAKASESSLEEPSKRYKITNGSGQELGTVFRSSYRWKADRLRAVLGEVGLKMLGISSISLPLWVLSIFIMGDAGPARAWIFYGILFCGGSGFLLASLCPLANDDLYVAITAHGIIRRWRKSTVLIPADDISGICKKYESYTIQNQQIEKRLVGVRLRSGREVILFEEFTLPRRSTIWPIDLDRLISVLDHAVSDYVERNTEFDRQAVETTVPPEGASTRQTESG